MTHVPKLRHAHRRCAWEMLAHAAAGRFMVTLRGSPKSIGLARTSLNEVQGLACMIDG